jgi:pantoate--beta-alanine ligase
MGFLHEGHLELIRAAKKKAKIVVVSIFVNPTQFLPGEDLDRYPRDFAGDRRKAASAGADAIFAPEAAEMYPEGFQTFVEVSQITRDFCGAARPGHFRGVATVVAKLFNIVQPDLAFFGEKDYQQLQCVRRLVHDLDFAVQIVGIPTVREADGLAMSSRNVYLSPEERNRALAISRGLLKARRMFAAGERDSSELTAVVLDILRNQAGLDVEYVAVCHPETLERLPAIDREAVILVAARVGKTRLIDNVRLRASVRR